MCGWASSWARARRLSAWLGSGLGLGFGFGFGLGLGLGLGHKGTAGTWPWPWDCLARDCVQGQGQGLRPGTWPGAAAGAWPGAAWDCLARDVAMGAGSRQRQFGLLKPRAAPCRACSASSRSLGRPAPPSPLPATSRRWLSLSGPGSRPACAARCRVQLKGACDHGRGSGYPARLRQQVGTFLVGLDCLERVRRVRLQPAHRQRARHGVAECWRSAESSHPVAIRS